MSKAKPASQAEPHSAPIPKVPTGIRGLDRILKGGLPLGRFIIFSGGPGTGKTVLAMEFLYRGAQAGEPGVFISFEENAEDLRANAAAMGMDTTALEEAGKLKVVHAAIPHGAVCAGEFDIQGLLAMLQGHVRALHAKRVVLDAVDVLMRIFGDSEREREELYVLHSRLRELGLTTVLTVKAMDGTCLYPFLDFMADCVLHLDQRMAGQVRTRRLCVRKYRGSHFLENEHPYVISPSGVVLMPVSSMALSQAVLRERVSSGNEKLDEVLGGGYLRGSCILLTGPSGAGKTNLACTFASEACRRGENTLYISFEEAQDVLIEEVSSAGIDLRSALDSSRLCIRTIMPEAAGPEEHLLWILDALDAWTPRHLVVDTVSACNRMSSKQGAFDFLVRLLTECKGRGVTCLFTYQADDPAKLLSHRGTGISSLVDTSIGLQYVDTGRMLRRRLLVIKSRGSRHSLAYHTLAITDRGIRLTSAEETTADEDIGRACQ